MLIKWYVSYSKHTEGQGLEGRSNLLRKWYCFQAILDCILQHLKGINYQNELVYFELTYIVGKV